MAGTASAPTTADTAPSPWQGFRKGLWQAEINVRDFIQQNYTPYEGDDSFLAPATERTTGIWAKLEALFLEERKKGVLDVSQIRWRMSDEFSPMPAVKTRPSSPPRTAVSAPISLAAR